MNLEIPQNIQNTLDNIRLYYDACKKDLDDYQNWKNKYLENILEYNPNLIIQKKRDEFTESFLNIDPEGNLTKKLKEGLYIKLINHFNYMIDQRINANNLIEIRKNCTDEIKMKAQEIEQQEQLIMDHNIENSGNNTILNNQTFLSNIKRKLLDLKDIVSRLEKIDSFIEETFVDFKIYSDEVIIKTKEQNLHFIRSLNDAFDKWQSTFHTDLNSNANSI